MQRSVRAILSVLTSGALALSGLAACADREELDAERPESLIGTWRGAGDAGDPDASADSVVLTLARDATATVRRWNARPTPAPFDSTAHYALWKVSGSPDDRGVTICLHLPATGANDCIPIRARGGDSLRLAFPARPAAPGSVVAVTLHRSATDLSRGQSR
jgi:hypothetical protein